jgi:hypothetical protein
VLYGGIFSWRYDDATTKKCESIQAAVIMPNKRKKEKKLKRRTETYGSN